MTGQFFSNFFQFFFSLISTLGMFVHMKLITFMCLNNFLGVFSMSAFPFYMHLLKEWGGCLAARTVWRRPLLGPVGPSGPQAKLTFRAAVRLGQRLSRSDPIRVPYGSSHYKRVPCRPLLTVRLYIYRQYSAMAWGWGWEAWVSNPGLLSDA